MLILWFIIPGYLILRTLHIASRFAIDFFAQFRHYFAQRILLLRVVLLIVGISSVDTSRLWFGIFVCGFNGGFGAGTLGLRKWEW